MVLEVVVLIPAYNEAEDIAHTLGSVRAQTRQVDLVLVVPNNCSDNTAEVARANGAEVWELAECPDKKAGALNYALERLDATFRDEDLVLIMDADTTISDDFVEVAMRELMANPDAGGISSIFHGRQSRSLLGNLQRMEYFRQVREIQRRANEAFVMSGTASLFRVSALRAVRAARREGVLLPRGESFYDVHSLTEDNELTFALKTLEYSCLAPGVTSLTDVMETPAKLVAQRRRWFLGALRNLSQYGLRLPGHLRWTYWRQQVGLFLALLFVSTMVLLTILQAIAVASGVQLRFSLVLTVIPTSVMLVERVLTVWKMGWKERLLAASLVPELLYSHILLFSFAVAVKDWARGHQGAWIAT